MVTGLWSVVAISFKFQVFSLSLVGLIRLMGPILFVVFAAQRYGFVLDCLVFY